MDPRREATVLLVEDNPDHAELTLRALADGGIPKKVVWVKDGEEALDYLHRRRAYADPTAAPRPDLILLDLKLTKIGGTEVLGRIKAEEDLCSIPVVMLTTSEREREVTQSYQAGVNSFVTKPVPYKEFIEQVRTIANYWFGTNKRPAAARAR
jgi:two-component system, response regulator